MELKLFLRTSVYLFSISLLNVGVATPHGFKEHFRDITKLECNDILYSPVKPTSESKLFVVQMGSSQFTYKTTVEEAVEKISPEIFKNHYVLAFDMPGVSTDLKKNPPREHLTWNTFTHEWKDGRKMEVYLLSDFYRAKNTDFSNCIIRSVTDALAEIGSRKIILLGYSMGGEVMSHFLAVASKKAPDLFTAIESVFLVAPFLELPKDNLHRQIETLTLLKKDIKTESKISEEDPTTGKVTERVEVRTGYGVTFKDVWNNILNIDYSYFQKKYYPLLDKFFFSEADFSFVYLKSVQESGGGAKDLETLAKKKVLPHTFIYQGVADWRTSTKVVTKLMKESQGSNAPLQLRFYDAGHDLFACPEFLPQIQSDMQLSRGHH